MEYKEPVETYHTSPHLYSDLDIPENVGNRLPRSQRKREGLNAEYIEDLGTTGSKARSRGRSRGRGRTHRKADDAVRTKQTKSRRPRKRTRGARRTKPTE